MAGMTEEEKEKYIEEKKAEWKKKREEREAGMTEE